MPSEHIESTKSKILTRTIIGFLTLVLLFVRYHMEPAKGEYVVAKEELPKKVVELAEALQDFPVNCSLEEFESRLQKAGLAAKPDLYKDGQHYWYLDRKFKRAARVNRMYTVSIGYHSVSDEKRSLYDAAIKQLKFESNHWRTVWKIGYVK